MKAIDTVMRKKWMSEEVARDQNALLFAQAEISFRAGMKEVVGWIDDNLFDYRYEDGFDGDAFHAKLREWGVD